MSKAEFIASLPDFARDGDGPVFEAPWQAKAFGTVLCLYEKGQFTWTEWADHLHRAIKSAQAEGDADLGDTYYEHWAAALEAILLEKAALSEDEIQRKEDDIMHHLRHEHSIDMVD